MKGIAEQEMKYSADTSKSYSTDMITMLINNRQLLDKVTSSQLQSLQDNIINHVFGGFESLINLLCKWKWTPCVMTVEMQHKLYQILTKNVESE